MSNAASLSLLKGGKKAALDEELKKPEPAPAEPAVEEGVETEVVDVDTMSGEELDTLVTENEIEVPEWWDGGEAEQKRAWLKEQFEEAPAAEAVPAEAPAAEEKPTEAVVEGTKASKKKASKSKAVATTNVKEGEIVQGDVITDLIHDIENLKEKEALELVLQLVENTEKTFIRLGGVLSVIQANGWHKDYASFRDFIEQKYGLEYRRAMYWIGIYNQISETKVTWEKVKPIGWTKLKEIASVLTPDNVDEWVKKAASMNTLTLIESVKAFKNKDAPKAVEDQTSKTVTTKTFKVHEDQRQTIDAAIEKAKSASGTQVDTAALEFICLDYMGSQTMVQKLQKMGIEAALEALEKAYPNAKIEVELTEVAA